MSVAWQRLGAPRSSHHNITKTKLLTMDILVLATMKNAVKCDTQCELQNSVNHQNFERILHSEVFLRVCLSQWHLPLSHPGFTPHSAVREECEPVTALAPCRSKCRVGPPGDSYLSRLAQRGSRSAFTARPSDR